MKAIKGIAMTPEMNAARAAGLKTQTRRLKKGDAPPVQVGDVLYIKERHKLEGYRGDDMTSRVCYDDAVAVVPITDADLALIKNRKKPFARLPGRYMLRSFARSYIKVTDVRSEYLRAITHDDAIAEGVKQTNIDFPDGTKGTVYQNYGYVKGGHPVLSALWYKDPVLAFITLWNSIHGRGPGINPNAFIKNPEVWVITFENYTPV